MKIAGIFIVLNLALVLTVNGQSSQDPEHFGEYFFNSFVSKQFDSLYFLVTTVKDLQYYQQNIEDSTYKDLFENFVSEYNYDSALVLFQNYLEKIYKRGLPYKEIILPRRPKTVRTDSSVSTIEQYVDHKYKKTNWKNIKYLSSDFTPIEIDGNDFLRYRIYFVDGKDSYYFDITVFNYTTFSLLDNIDIIRTE